MWSGCRRLLWGRPPPARFPRPPPAAAGSGPVGPGGGRAYAPPAGEGAPGPLQPPSGRGTGTLPWPGGAGPAGSSFPRPRWGLLRSPRAGYGGLGNSGRVGRARSPRRGRERSQRSPAGSPGPFSIPGNAAPLRGLPSRPCAGVTGGSEWGALAAWPSPRCTRLLLCFGGF